MEIDFAALCWRRAYEWPLLRGDVKQNPADFEVDEILGFEPDGNGEHDLLWLRKESNNTQWVADQLAKYAGLEPHEVGFCGLKDRHAVTRQWFSVRRPSASGTDWRRCNIGGVEIIERHRHRKKLRRGIHKGNHFVVTIRNVNSAVKQVDPGLMQISQLGVPNYFGLQRFGRNGDNLRLASDAFSGKRLRKSRLGIAISAARALVFNSILASRVEQNCWQTALPGEALNLHGSNSTFVSNEITAELEGRLIALDIHPTAALWGRGEAQCHGDARHFEENAVSDFKIWCDGLEKIGANTARRATRLRVEEFSWQWPANSLRLEFTLRGGGFATSVLREIVASG